MALKFGERVKETTTTTGTGTYSLGGTSTGFQTFVAGIGGSEQTGYLVSDGTDWEVGIGTITDSAPDTLSRDIIIASTNGGAAVSWAAGGKDVISCWPAAYVGSLVKNQSAVSTDQSPVIDDGGMYYECNTTSGDVTINLPAISTVWRGYTIFATKTNANNSVIFDPSTTETIEGLTTYSWNQINQTVAIFSNGSEWKILSISAPIKTKTIYVPATAMMPTVSNGCGALAQTETTAGRPDMNTLAFDATVDEHAQFNIAMPKAWDGGTVTFKVYWTGLVAGAGGVSWGLQGVSVSNDDTLDVAYGTPIVVDDIFILAEDVHVSPLSTAVTIAGTPADDDVVYFRIFRDVSDTNDTRAVDANLLGVAIFYTVKAETDA